MSSDKSKHTPAPDYVIELLRLEKAVKDLQPVDGIPNTVVPSDREKFDRVIRVGGAIFSAMIPSQENGGDPLTRFFRNATSAVEAEPPHTGNFLAVANRLLGDYAEISVAIAEEDSQRGNQGNL